MLFKCMIHSNLPWIPITRKHHLSSFSSPACGLPSYPLSPILTLSRCLLQSVVMQRAFGGFVCFSFSAGAVLSLLPKRAFPLVPTCCVCCKVSHHSQASACLYLQLCVSLPSRVLLSMLSRMVGKNSPIGPLSAFKSLFYRISLVIMLIKNQNTKTKKDLTLQ